jgi:glucose/arabinose dehydrogenase
MNGLECGLRAPCAVWLPAVAAVLAVAPADASRFGRNGFSGDPDTNGGAVCSVCHAPGEAQSPQVFLQGPTQVDAGDTVRYTVTLLGGPAVTGGVNVSVSGAVGSLVPVDDSLQLVAEELAHTEPQPFAGDQLTFAFDWTAPAWDTDVVFYAAGNSTNGNLDLENDGVASATFDVAVVNGFEDPPPPPPPPSPSAVALETVASGLAAPVVVTSAGDERLFVAEQEGRVRVISPDGTLRATPFLDITDRVKLGFSEEGLLGLVFHPDYAKNGRFFVNYIFDPGARRDRTRISQFEVSADDPDLADPASEVVLLEFPQPFDNHNGGDMHFGPDGLLYIASGDGGSGGDPRNLAQDPAALLGKILRIDVDGTPGPGTGPDCALPGASYAVPPGNAWNDGPGGEGCDEVFALGLRNPWRMAFDRETGDLWIADVGQSDVEEVSVIPSGAAGGLNLGWRCFEGSEPYDLSGCDGSYLAPVFEYTHDAGDCSITGGFVYRGSDFPGLRGQYFFSDFCNPAVRSLSGPLSALVETEVLEAGDFLFSTFGEDARGELYAADFIGGIVYRLVATAVDLTGDVDGDGDVDAIDLGLVWRARGTAAAPGDPRDIDGDGRITRQDVFLVFSNCTREGCAVA